MKYHFSNQNSYLQEIDIHLPHKELEAVIYAPDTTQSNKLSEIKMGLEQDGYRVFADAEDGRAVLRVSGFDAAEKILTSLENYQALAGDYTVEPTEVDKTQHKSIIELIQSKALTLSGLVYLCGDISLGVAGAIRGDADEITGAILWGIPSFSLMIAGSQNPDTQMSFLYQDFHDFLEHNNMRMPQDVKNLLEEKESGHNPVEWLQRQVYQHGAEINNFMQLLGGAKMMQAGFLNQNNWMKGAAGSFVVSGMALGMTIPEKSENNTKKTHNLEVREHRVGENLTPNITPETELHHKKDVISDTVEWFMEKPLRFSGIFGLVNNGLNFGSKFFIERPRMQQFNTEYDSLKDSMESIGQRLREGEQFGDIARNETALNTINGMNQLIANKNLSGGTAMASEQAPAIPTMEATNNFEGALKFENTKEMLDARKHTLELSANAANFNMLSSSFYLIGNTLYSCASKNNGADLEAMGGINTIMAMAANVVSEYPEHLQKAVTQRIATFLGNHQYVPFGVDDAVSILNNKVAVLSQSDWLDSSPHTADAHGATTISKRFSHAARLDAQLPEQGAQPESTATPDSRILETNRELQEKLFTQPSQLALV